MGLSGEDIPIQFDNHPAGSNRQFIEQLCHADPLCDLSLLPVDLNDHPTKKTVPDLTTQVAREYGLKFVPLLPQSAAGTVTFTLPYAGTIRIRFKGLPGTAMSGSQSASGEHPQHQETTSRRKEASQTSKEFSTFGRAQRIGLDRAESGCRSASMLHGPGPAADK